MTTKTPVIIFLYNRLFDPLIQGNFWLYIDSYLNDSASQVRFHVITYEDPKHPLTDEQKTIVEQWKSQGMEWTALSWHPGIGIKQKLADLIAGFRVALRLRCRGFRHIVTLGSVAGTFAYLYSIPLRLRQFLYQYEPHSEYAVDNGMWPANSLQTRLSRLLERRAAQGAAVVASGTRFMEERVKQVWRSQAKFVKVPTVANDQKFIFDSEVRKRVRTQLGITEDQSVLFYPGKFDGLYYGDETAFMFRWLLDMDSSLHFLIVTPHDDDEVHGRFDRAGVPRDAYTICHSDYAGIHPYFFAADFAVIAVPPGPSKKFISNIKVGEYLCAGLPYLITRGVSEDYLFAEENDVGVVVDDFTESDIKAAWPKIQDYLERDADERRKHCRDKGLGYRGFDTLNPRFRHAIDILMGHDMDESYDR
ncbi:MAG: hypothetical protein P1U78_07950 [Alcanivoracaceae bacterium]|nr:hypothetical protein [Alcanivoracaceae bacterium]